MDTKPQNILNNLTSVTNTPKPMNGELKIENPTAEISGTSKISKAQLLLRLKEMEDINAQLADIVIQGTKKIDDVVATNARFLSIVTHDLRSPIITAISILNLLQEQFSEYNETEIKRLINIASISTVRSLNLLENLLTWSVSQNKEKTFNPVKIDLNKLVISELEDFNTSATQKQLTLNHSIDPGLYITADFQMVKTIFRNLISNAIKYSNMGGHIFISATEGKQFVEIEVSDNGIGMSERVQKKLFKIDEFHSTTGTNNEPGTGLGLIFCKEFIDLHGGKIYTESESGKGSKFIFTLPHYI
jgi:signal transduction histidine kinase